MVIAPAGNLRTNPWRHQREAVAFVQQLYRRGKRGAMIAAVMGTGKSAMTVYLCAEEGFQLVLILCPLRVVQVWKPQFEMHSGIPFLVVALDDTFSNVKAKRDEAHRKINLAKARGVPVVVVINYDSAWRTPFAEWALKQKWDLVVADEIHRCKAPGGKASRYLARLGKAARLRLGLSGTPMPHSPLDVYGYFRFIDATIFGWSFNRFRQHFAVMGGYQNHQVVDYDNLDELNRKFYSVAYSCGKDVLDLPPEMHVTLTCQLGGEARRAYRSLKRNLMAELDAGEVTVANALVKLLRLQQITGGYIRTDDGQDVQIDSAKMNLLRDVLEDIDPQEPVIVFCRFHKDLEVAGRTYRSNAHDRVAAVQGHRHHDGRGHIALGRHRPFTRMAGRPARRSMRGARASSRATIRRRRTCARGATRPVPLRLVSHAGRCWSSATTTASRRSKCAVPARISRTTRSSRSRRAAN
jgi:SNF2 family DNA or RNA helicase